MGDYQLGRYEAMVPRRTDARGNAARVVGLAVDGERVAARTPHVIRARDGYARQDASARASVPDYGNVSGRRGSNAFDRVGFQTVGTFD